MLRGKAPHLRTQRVNHFAPYVIYRWRDFACCQTTLTKPLSYREHTPQGLHHDQNAPIHTPEMYSDRRTPKEGRPKHNGTGSQSGTPGNYTVLHAYVRTALALPKGLGTYAVSIEAFTFAKSWATSFRTLARGGRPRQALVFNYDVVSLGVHPGPPVGSLKRGSAPSTVPVICGPSTARRMDLLIRYGANSAPRVYGKWDSRES